jgi:two-component system, response regulator PdtaR
MDPVESSKLDVGDHRSVVLIVEDDFLVRWAAAEYLRDAGYGVIEAAAVTEAIVVLSCDKHVDIVFSDVNLPGEFTGHTLACWLGKYHPELPMLMTSGDPSASGLISIGATRSFLGKPYALAEVDRRLKEMLSRK